MARIFLLLLFLPFSLAADSPLRWHQHPYETPHDHMARLATLAESEETSLTLLEEELTRLLEKKASILEKISRLESQKEKLESTFLKEPAPLSPSPFTLYLVCPGDTLYSLALRYYGSGAFFTSIAEWNADWVQDPNQITAGMALLLFSSPGQLQDTLSLADYLAKERLRMENFL